MEHIEKSPDISEERKAEDAVLPDARHADGLPLSPKIVKGDQDQDVDARDEVDAKPALDQGSPLKAQGVAGNEIPAQPDVAKSPAHGVEAGKEDDTAEEKVCGFDSRFERRQ